MISYAGFTPKIEKKMFAKRTPPQKNIHPISFISSYNICLTPEKQVQQIPWKSTDPALEAWVVSFVLRRCVPCWCVAFPAMHVPWNHCNLAALLFSTWRAAFAWQNLILDEFDFDFDHWWWWYWLIIDDDDDADDDDIDDGDFDCWWWWWWWWWWCLFIGRIWKPAGQYLNDVPQSMLVLPHRTWR